MHRRLRSPSPFELEGLSPRIDWGETASLALLASDDRLYSVNAFNCDQVRLDIFDTHDPQHVFDGLGTVDLPSTGSEEHAGIAVVSNYVVVATTPGDVMVVDVSDPTSPEYVAGVQIPQGSRRIVRYGDYLLLLGDDVPMEVVDVSDPLVPTYISSADLIGWGGVLHEDRLYVPGSGKVGVYDLADVLDPVFVGDFSASGDPDRVEFYGNLLYTGPALLGSDFPEENPRGFEIYDVSSGAVGLPVTTLSTDGTPVSIAESGNRCVVARGTSGLAVVDLTDPLSPVLLPGAVLGDFLEVDVEGNLVAALTPSELCLFDLSSTGGLLPRGTLSFGTGVWQVHLSGSICALRNETVIRIVDVSSPDVPVEVSDVSLGGSYLSVSGETLAATNFDGVHIYSLANPSQPSLLVDLPIEYVPSWCGVDENLLFVSKWAFNEVQVFDLTEPTAPALITNINLPGLESSVIRNGSHLFIQTKESAVTAWDVSDMESPSQIYTVRSPGIELGGVVVDGHPVGFDSGGLVIFPSVCEETSDVGSDGSVVSASDSPGRWSLRVSPSPSLGGAIEFSWPTSTTERRAIQVFDAAGRAVASVPVTQGVGSVVWNPSDLVDPLPSGTYWATWAKAQSEAVRFVVVQ